MVNYPKGIVFTHHEWSQGVGRAAQEDGMEIRREVDAVQQSFEVDAAMIVKHDRWYGNLERMDSRKRIRSRLMQEVQREMELTRAEGSQSSQEHKEVENSDVDGETKGGEEQRTENRCISGHPAGNKPYRIRHFYSTKTWEISIDNPEGVFETDRWGIFHCADTAQVEFNMNDECDTTRLDWERCRCLKCLPRHHAKLPDMEARYHVLIRIHGATIGGNLRGMSYTDQE